jgi:transcriptional regulator with PAS, ATPase and Fis domain
MNKRIEVIPTHAIEALSRHSWPGNIRQYAETIGSRLSKT